MRITIEDLESLQALNDEMEEHNLETEKVMQEDISNTSDSSRFTKLMTFL